VKEKWFGMMRDTRNQPLDEVPEEPGEAEAVY
jgi:hypothetical protein